MKLGQGQGLPFRNLKESQGLLLGLLISVLLSVADGLTGYEVSFSFFYLLPVFLVAWTGSTSTVWAIAVTDAVLWQSSNFLAGEHHTEAWIYLWNAASRGGFFVVTGVLVVRIRKMLVHEAATARRDPLTGLLNRRGLEEVFASETARLQRRPTTIGLISMDLDHFKQLNDSAGHAEGDRLLVELARVGGGTLRPSDTFARLGGDEFLVLVVGTDSNAVSELASRFRARVEEAFRDQGWNVSLSQGICLHSEGLPPWPELLERADRQLYRAKTEGRARICMETTDPRPSQTESSRG